MAKKADRGFNYTTIYFGLGTELLHVVVRQDAVPIKGPTKLQCCELNACVVTLLYKRTATILSRKYQCVVLNE